MASVYLTADKGRNLGNAVMRRLVRGNGTGEIFIVRFVHLEEDGTVDRGDLGLIVRWRVVESA